MNICPHCGTGSPDPEFCLDCGVKITHCHHPEEDASPDRALRGRPVYRAPDELAAETVSKVLESEGIPSWVQSEHGSGYEGILQAVEGAWGTVMVYEDQEARARQVIEEYFKGLGPGLH